MLLALLAALLLLPDRSAADEPGEDTPPLISNMIVTPGGLPPEGGKVTVSADVVDDVGVTTVYGEFLGTDGGFQSVELIPSGETSYIGSVNLPANFMEWPVSYSVYVWASDTNEAFASEWAGEVQIEATPPFDEAPTVWDPSVEPRQLPATGGPVTIRASASDTRSISEVYAAVTLPGGGATQVQLEPISFTGYEGVFTAPPNAGTAVEQYAIEVVALDDIGQSASAAGGHFIVAPAADPSCSGAGVAGNGSNSLLQWQAQRLWSKTYATEVCPGDPAPRFGPVWPNKKTDFIGTEAPPSPAQIAGMTGGGGASLAVIPVAQTSIAIVARPPKECAVEKITNRQLEQVFRGVIELWSQLNTAKGSRCKSPVRRVVPQVGVGIASQFKSYLARMKSGVLPCVGKTWLELRWIDDAKTGAPNVTWPEGCAAATEIVRPGSLGGGVVQTVNRTGGSIGFASLPEAKLKDAHSILRLQNDGQLLPETKTAAATASFASPEVGGRANCDAATYHVPPGARRRPGESGLNADWSQVVGADPAVGGTSYPLCMLTYDLAFHGYQYRPDRKISFRRAQTVRDYLKEFVVRPEGQALLAAPGSFYAPLPTATHSSEDVLAAAQHAASKIRY